MFGPTKCWLIGLCKKRGMKLRICKNEAELSVMVSCCGHQNKTSGQDTIHNQSVLIKALLKSFTFLHASKMTVG